MDVTGQRRVKNAGGTRAGAVGSPGGGVRLLGGGGGACVCVCVFGAAGDVLKQLLPLNGKKIAHKFEWRRIENKSRETALDRGGRQVGRGDG